MLNFNIQLSINIFTDLKMFKNSILINLEKKLVQENLKF